MTENEISAQILDAAIEVHKEIGGPGMLESYYEAALAYELRSRGLNVETQKRVPMLHLKLGIVVNFGQPKIVDGFFRVANGL